MNPTQIETIQSLGTEIRVFETTQVVRQTERRHLSIDVTFSKRIDGLWNALDNSCVLYCCGFDSMVIQDEHLRQVARDVGYQELQAWLREFIPIFIGLRARGIGGIGSREQYIAYSDLEDFIVSLQRMEAILAETQDNTGKP